MGATKAVPENFVHMVAVGMSDTEIAEIAGVSARTILRWRKQRNLPSRWMPPPVNHGTTSGYDRGCRCEDCRDAHRVQHAILRATRKNGPVRAEHGNPNTYSNWSCRCEPCRAAWRVKMRDYAEKVKARREQ